MKLMKKTLCLFLALVMAVSMLPLSALATESEPLLTVEAEDGMQVDLAVEAVEEDETQADDAEAVADAEEAEPAAAEELVEDEEVTLDTYMAEKPTAPADGTITLGDDAASPFVKGTAGSNSFRIPAMVTLSDGTLVAAADARWNATYDGGGADTIVARSTDNGATWDYTFANYLGDHGNVYNGPESTAFIDPALAVTADDTIYMLVDIYPYGVALNGSGNTWPSTDLGFDDNGNLLLSDNNGSSYNYYLNTENGLIYLNGSSDAFVEHYTVEENFDLYKDGVYVSNLFFSDSPYKVVRTGYLYLTKSTDGGETWSDEPTLLPNIKTTSEQVCLVSPGRGTVLSDGTIIFPVYSYYNHGSYQTQRADLIYSTDDGATWQRSAGPIDNWSSEASVVELSAHTLRAFYRNGTSCLCYVDITRNSGSFVWGSPVQTSVACNSNTEMSALKVTAGGTDYILVSNPGNQSSQSGASYRTNGQIVTFKASNMSVVQTTSVPSVHTTNSFMYSCMSQLNNGDIAILYEDQESGWGAGSNYYYQMSFKTYTLDELGIDTSNTSVTLESNGVSVTAPGLTGLTVTETTPAPRDDCTAIGYDITPVGYVDGTEATVTMPLPVEMEGKNVTVVVYDVKEGKDIATISSSDITDNKITFTTNHFSKYNGYIFDETSPIDVAVELTVGETSRVYTVSKTTNYGNAVAEDMNGIAEYTQVGTDKVEASTTYVGPDDVAVGSLGATSEFYIKTDYFYNVGDQYYPVYVKYYSIGYEDWLYVGYSTTDDSTDVTQIGTSYKYKTSTIKVYTRQQVEATPASTTIQFTSLAEGTASVTVGNRTYIVTVSPKQETKKVTVRPEDSTALAVNLPTGGSVSFAVTSGADKITLTDDGTVTGTAAGTAKVLATVKNAAGKTVSKITFDVVVSNYSVVEEALSLNQYADQEITLPVTLSDGQTVAWTSTDASVAGVGAVYSGTDATNKAIVLGNAAGEAVVTGTVKDAEGTVIAVYKWNTTVTAVADTNTTSRYIYVKVTQIEHCTVYYAINGGELIKLNGTGVLIDEQKDGHFNIMFFAAPDEGYALTYMCVTGSAKQYYVLSNGNADGTGSDAWPFNSNTQTTIPTSSSDSQWKSGHGFRWSLLEGNMTINRMKAMFAQAIALGCDGATNFTKNSTGNFYTEVQFAAQPLPTLTKEIIKVNADEFVGQPIGIGDTITYKLTVTRPAYVTGDVWSENSYTSTSPITTSNKPTYTSGNYGTITYSDEALTDALTNNAGINNPSMGTSGADAETYTCNTTLTLTMDNWSSVVQDGTITNTADLNYQYKSQYSSGKSDAMANDKAVIDVSVPEYVVDFGLPVTIDLSEILTAATITAAESSKDYAAITIDGKTITYTLNTVMKGRDIVNLTLSNGGSYSVNIYPATSVYYEEGFATYESGWTGGTTNGGLTTKQAEQIAGLSSDVYGYDEAYNNVTATTYATVTKPDSGSSPKAVFTFVGTGLDIYAMCTATSGTACVELYDADGNMKKLAFVNTSTKSELYNLTADEYCVPIVSLDSLPYGQYTVYIFSVKGTINLDGFRVYGTMQVEPDFYKADKEDKPVYDELRDRVLTASGYNVSTENGQNGGSSFETNALASKQAQVYYDNLQSELTVSGYSAVVLPASAERELTADELTEIGKLVDHGTKNELFLADGAAVTFALETRRMVQLGMKGVDGTGTVNVKIGSDSTGTNISVLSTTEMYYTVSAPTESSSIKLITITNNSGHVISLTNVKVCDDPDAALQTLTEDELAAAFQALGLMTTGDADGNGAVNLRDVASAYRKYTSAADVDAYTLRVLDLNSDGQLNLLDVSALYRLYTKGV